MGRKARAEAPAKLFNFRLSAAERDRLERAARANHQSAGDFARLAIVTAADECLEDAPSAIS
jgi:uncharacterized protein (DUF1778 family)